METTQPPQQYMLEDYARASSGKRFANYIIDVIVFYILIFVVSFVIAITYPPYIEFLESDVDRFPLADRVVSLILYALYMSFTETIFKGKSIGKFITKTRAVYFDGSEITTATAFGRGFGRAVPFAVFSALGTPCNPWHDRWNNTMVVDEQTLKELEQHKLQNAEMALLGDQAVLASTEVTDSNNMDQDLSRDQQVEGSQDQTMESASQNYPEHTVPSSDSSSGMSVPNEGSNTDS